MLLTAIVFITGCGSPDVSEKKQGNKVVDTDFSRTVIDVAGNEINIESKPIRIVSVIPSVTEILYDLGLEDKIVGVTENCDYPKIASKKKKVGDWNINLEKLISLEPDLVVGKHTTNEVLLNEISNLGINTLMIEAQNFEEIYKSFEIIAMATGTEDKAQDIITDMKTRIEAVEKKVITLGDKERKRVFFEVGWEPLYTVGLGSLQHEILDLAGGINVVDANKAWVKYSNEKLIEIDPDVIIMGTHPYYTAEDAKNRTGWSQLTAVKKDQVIDTIDTNILVRPTYRAVEGLEEVAKSLYPDLFN
ncbi:ABC transporter substrate-binding protein [Candidatus Syntrophocurvum alkaliphilum]|uniref:ABC transporter substrate-binding protein n=1 Tax=Candidatus Syntrophocurvum alkaliphilum TaxID=2293317 RepID=UPI0018CF1259|nr:helical backbone metal receptor [Candidatus Syntrophocurvum alkaliphilum]